MFATGRQTITSMTALAARPQGGLRKEHLHLQYIYQLLSEIQIQILPYVCIASVLQTNHTTAEKKLIKIRET